MTRGRVFDVRELTIHDGPGNSDHGLPQGLPAPVHVVPQPAGTVIAAGDDSRDGRRASGRDLVENRRPGGSPQFPRPDPPRRRGRRAARAGSLRRRDDRSPRWAGHRARHVRPRVRRRVPRPRPAGQPRLGDCPGRILWLERPERDGLEEASERPVGPRTVPNRPGDAATTRANETSAADSSRALARSWRRALPGSATRSMSSIRTIAVRWSHLPGTRRRSDRRRSVSTVWRDRRSRASAIPMSSPISRSSRSRQSASTPASTASANPPRNSSFGCG